MEIPEKLSQLFHLDRKHSTQALIGYSYSNPLAKEKIVGVKQHHHMPESSITILPIKVTRYTNSIRLHPMQTAVTYQSPRFPFLLGSWSF